MRWIDSLSRHTACALPVALVTIAALAMPPAQAATITVTTLADAIPPVTDGQCSLREALANATDDAATHPDCPAGTGDDEITFAANLFSPLPPRVGTILLAGELVAGKVSGTAHALSIRPPVAGAPFPTATRLRLVASTASPHRVMSVFSTASPFTLVRANIEGGHVSDGIGGGMRLNSEAASLTGVSFIDNQAQFYGGGLHFGGQQLELDTVRFEGNAARYGGALVMRNVRGDFQARVKNSFFSDNRMTTGGFSGGGNIYFELQDYFPAGDAIPSLEITDSTLADNPNGAVFLRSGEGSNQRFRLTATNNLFSNNMQGAMTVRGTRIRPGTAPAQNSGGDVFLHHNSFIGNQSISGGALDIVNANLVLENNLFSGNRTSYRGGALFYQTDDALPVPRRVALIGNTFHDQRIENPFPAPGGRTLWVETESAADIARWHMAGNLFAPAASAPPAGLECQHADGSFLALPLTGGDNLSPVSDCVLLPSTDILDEPMVSVSESGNAQHPLAVLPQPGSPAIDAWPADACTDHSDQPLAHDLRDQPRPTDGDGSGIADCDIGAFELPALPGADLIFANGFE